MADDIDVGAFVEFEAAGFSKVADRYNHHFSPLTGRLAEPLLDAAGVGNGTRVLDVAAGPGQVAAEAAARGATVLGLDLSAEMVKLAEGLHPDIEFQQGDVHDLAIPDASYDAVVANFVMPHLGDHPRAVSEMARVLVDGGRLALTTWDLPARSPIPGAMFLAVQQAGAPLAPDVPPGPSFYRYSEDAAFADLLRDAGLADVTVTDVEFTHAMESPDAFWDALLEGSVRASAQVRGQTSELQREIRRTFDGIVEPYRRGDRLELPVSVKVGAGRKPLTS
jgi:ubiquinone/menaquinone biosynthesis C-methylase UbiE